MQGISVTLHSQKHMKERRFMEPEYDHTWMHHGHEHMGMQMHHCSHAYAYSASAGPGMLLPTLGTVLWIVCGVVLAWALLQWFISNVLPEITGYFGKGPEDSFALEILRQRYAAGEIDAATFEHMRERLEASYSHDEPRSAS
jgi:uncharacterized membrane protein